MPTEPLNCRCKSEARGLLRVSLWWSRPLFFVMLSTLEEEGPFRAEVDSFSGKSMPNRSLDKKVLLVCEISMGGKEPGTTPVLLVPTS